mmetsp:Transcript_26604/g.75117  ORF Transcript_26604/g.75117 Transcript_26604/m.75117 type:complete len:235 (-) Transcript_26604:862-1566(-)
MGPRLRRGGAPVEPLGVGDHPEPGPRRFRVALRASNHGAKPPLALVHAEEEEHVMVAVLLGVLLVHRARVAEPGLLHVLLAGDGQGARDDLVRVRELHRLFRVAIEAIPVGVDAERRERGAHSVGPDVPFLDRCPQAPVAPRIPERCCAECVGLVVHCPLVQLPRGPAVHAICHTIPRDDPLDHNMPGVLVPRRGRQPGGARRGKPDVPGAQRHQVVRVGVGHVPGLDNLLGQS